MQTWGKWKDLYKKVEKQARVKCQAACGQGQFGGALLRVGAGGAVPPGGRVTPVKIDESEGCFDILDTMTATGETTLDELVTTNSTLTSFIATNNQITKEVASLSQEVHK